ncbi:MAG: hypothetical protein Q4A16_02690 [Lautropia sp.]|nr:hypothetical protein [Lautropia sp.]
MEIHVSFAAGQKAGPLYLEATTMIAEAVGAGAANPKSGHESGVYPARQGTFCAYRYAAMHANGLFWLH